MSSGPVALITGGARRIGRAVAVHLLQKNWQVVIQYRNSRQEAHALAQEYPGRVEILQGELEEEAFCEGLVLETYAKFGGLDLLVNSASCFSHHTFGETRADDWDREFAVNVRAPFLLAQSMARLKGTGHAGRLIVNLSDASITRPQKGVLAYLTSKAALTGMTRHLAAEMAPAIRVNALALGLMLPSEGESDPLPKGHSLPLKEYGGEQPILDAMDYFLKDQFVTGAVLQVDGGRYA